MATNRSTRIVESHKEKFVATDGREMRCGLRAEELARHSPDDRLEEAARDRWIRDAEARRK
jgi:hypothetical protein